LNRVPAHLLSVVMPTHNRSSRVERAAHSVLEQQGADVELVIVDDASSDGTPEVTDRLAHDKRVRLVRNDHSLGPGGSRNRGIAAARGDLLGFCDDDDTWMPGAAAAVVDRMQEAPEAGVVTSWHQVVHDQTGRVALFRGPVHVKAAQLLWFDLNAVPFGVIRRSKFPDDLAVDADLESCEDWDLWLRCAQTSPISTVPRALYSYHQHAGIRVTRGDSAAVRGRRGFLERHTRSMTSSCRIYHELVLGQLEGGRPGIAAQVTEHGRMPIATAVAASLLTASSIASTVGVRRRDPGLPARTMSRLLAGVDTGRSSRH
jgi:glycosyltransferase involved in cell wall biosynthesis